MNREEYNYCSSSLRKLLSLLGEGDFRRRVKYRFGLQYNPRFNFYHLWDGEQAREVGIGTRATIKLLPDKAIVRVWKSDFPFKEQLLKFQLPDRESIFIPSVHVTKHDSWIEARIQSHINRRIQQRLAFLASKTQEHQVAPYTLRVTFQEPYDSYRAATSTSVPQLQVSVLDIVFDGSDQFSQWQDVANMMVTELYRDFNARWSHGYAIPFSELATIYNREVSSRRELDTRRGIHDRALAIDYGMYEAQAAESLQRIAQGQATSASSNLVDYSELIRRIQ